MAKKTQPIGEAVRIVLPKLQIQRMTLTLIGDSPLIVHKWSEKAKKEMLDKQMKKVTKTGRAAKDPEQDFKDSLYTMSGGRYGFPAVGFKSCAVDAASFVEGLTKVEMRGAMHIDAEEDDLVLIEGKPTMREDMVRVGMGTADIRHRGEFREWKAVVNIAFNAAVLSAQQ